MKLVAINSIWSRNPKKRAAPGDVFEVTDQASIDRLLSTGAARVHYPAYSAAPVVPPATPSAPAVPPATSSPSAPVNTESANPADKEAAGSESDSEQDSGKTEIEEDAEGGIDTDTGITDGSAASDIEPPPYQIPGIGQDTISILVAGGYDTLDKVAAASKTDLVKVPKIGYQNAIKIIKALEAK